MNTVEICTPKFNLAYLETPHVSIFQNLHNDDAHLLSCFRVNPSPIQVPVMWREELFPFRIASKSFQKPTHISLWIEKRREPSCFNMRVANFGSLSKLFSQGVLHATVQCFFGGYNFAHEPESFEIDNHGMGQCVVKPSVNFTTELQRNPQLYEMFHGLFTIDILWKCSFILQGRFFSYATDTDARKFPGNVTLITDSRRQYYHIPKQLLADSSEYFKAQFEFNPETVEIIPYLDESKRIGDESLFAFVQYIVSSALSKPIENCSIALDLLKAGHYCGLGKMETTMQNILLAQPTSWYNLKTSFAMFSYANKLCSIMNDGDDKAVWENIKWKALRNLQSANPQELAQCEEIPEELLNDVAFDIFTTLISVA